MEPDAIHERSSPLELLRASEHRLMEGVCTFTHEEGYAVIRSEAFPRFYAGNGLSQADDIPREASRSG